MLINNPIRLAPKGIGFGSTQKNIELGITLKTNENLIIL